MFCRNRLADACAVVVVFLVLVAFLSPLLVHFGLSSYPIKQEGEHIEAGPGQFGHPFGTDELGRDTLSRLMYGSRISLSVGILVQGIILPIGLAIGLTAGYFCGARRPPPPPPNPPPAPCPPPPLLPRPLSPSPP